MIDFIKGIFSEIKVNKISHSGRSILISNGKVMIDGKDVTPNEKIINISVTGNIENLSVDSAERVEVSGDVSSLKTMSGDISIKGNVKGNINNTSGDLEIGGSVGGDIKLTSGDIKCGDVGGSIKTMSGDIKHRKK